VAPVFNPAGGGRRASSAALRRDDRWAWPLELAFAALLVVSLAGMHRVFTGTAWIGPIVGTALGVQAVAALTRRLVESPPLAGLIDLAAVAGLTVWTVVPSTTTYGVPTGATWRVVHDALSSAGDRFAAATVPVAPDPGFLLLAVLGAGFVALTGSWLVHRLYRTLGGALPPFAAFIACCCLGTRADRSWSTGLLIVAVLVLLVADRLWLLHLAGYFAAHVRSAGSRTLVATLPIGLAALVVGLAAVPLASSADGRGLLGWRGDGEDSTRIVISPLVTLQTRLLPAHARTEVFTVRSTTPSYWRLTSLDDFDGTEWNAKDNYETVGSKLPGLTGVPAGTRRVEEDFSIQALYSAWLPLAFDPQSVSGAPSVTYDPSTGSLLTQKKTSNGFRYSVTSLQYLATLSPRSLAAAGAVPHDSATAPYLQLPALPTDVTDLAHQIVGNATTEYAKALALEQYFHGPEFTYSLDPQPDTNQLGESALQAFLFNTRSGYCQQFAGSYAVLARVVGIPTRLAVGFTTGQRQADGAYQVTDADAHTWPEVWFPKYGWVPFEPTKGGSGASFTIPNAAYTGATAAAPTGRTKTVPGPTPTTAPTTPATTVPTGVTTPPTTGSGASFHHRGATVPGAAAAAPKPVHRTLRRPTRHTPHHRALAFTIAVALGLVLAGPVLAGTNLLRRRIRWATRRRRVRPEPVGSGPSGADSPPSLPGASLPAASLPGASAPDASAPDASAPGASVAGASGTGAYGADAVTVVWDEVAERLAWRGFRRRAGETHREFARRVGADLRGAGEGALPDDLYGLAALTDRAAFARGGVPAGDLAAGEAAARRIRRILDRQITPRERLRLLLDPRVAWAPATVVAAEPLDVQSDFWP
jgi:transglutaminase-like putative cysteine protease